MEFIGSTKVRFKSVTPWFELERSGEKPNTVRLVTDREYGRLLQCDTIIVQRADGATIRRTIDAMYDISSVGKVEMDEERCVLICWTHPNREAVGE